MNTYPHICPQCNSPARKTKAIILCSNVKCKSWKTLRTLSANVDRSKIAEERGLTPDNPIILRCPTCDRLAHREGSAHIICEVCKKTYSYTYIKNNWYYYRTNINVYCRRYLGNDNPFYSDYCAWGGYASTDTTGTLRRTIGIE